MNFRKIAFGSASFVIMVICLLAYISFVKNPLTTISNTPQKSQKNKINEKNIQTEAEYYVNEKYGFRIKMPKGWEKYQAVENLGIVDFYLPIKKYPDHDLKICGEYMMSPVKINVWTKDIWNTEKSRCAKETLQGCQKFADDYSGIIGENNKYIFELFFTSDLLPDDLANLDEEGFQPDYWRKNFSFVPTTNN